MKNQKDELTERIKALKALRNKAVLENRREVYNEVSEKKENLMKTFKLQDGTDQDDEEEVEQVVDSNGENDSNATKVKDLEYTAEETEEWSKSHEKHPNYNGDLQLQNFKTLAANTYNKNVKELKGNGLKAKEEYLKEKSAYSELKAQGLTEAEIRSKMTSTESLNNFVKKIEKWEKNKYQKRGKIGKEGTDSAIHEKNRQFNEKLKRHLSQVEK